MYSILVAARWLKNKTFLWKRQKFSTFVQQQQFSPFVVNAICCINRFWAFWTAFIHCSDSITHYSLCNDSITKTKKKQKTDHLKNQQIFPSLAFVGKMVYFMTKKSAVWIIRKYRREQQQFRNNSKYLYVVSSVVLQKWILQNFWFYNRKTGGDNNNSSHQNQQNLWGTYTQLKLNSLPISNANFLRYTRKLCMKTYQMQLAWDVIVCPTTTTSSGGSQRNAYWIFYGIFFFKCLIISCEH